MREKISYDFSYQAGEPYYLINFTLFCGWFVFRGKSRFVFVLSTLETVFYASNIYIKSSAITFNQLLDDLAPFSVFELLVLKRCRLKP